MANNDPDFRSVSGQAETAEPTNTNTNTAVPALLSSSASSTATQRRSASANRSQSTTTAKPPTLRKQSSSSLLPHSSSPSAGASPRTSRNTSPIRKDSRPSGPPSFSTQPSAAAIQRALSASSVPQLSGGGAVTEAVSKLHGRGGSSGDNTPQWPVSPRLKSPPPSAVSSRRGSAAVGAAKKGEGSSTSSPLVGPPPSISVHKATPTENTASSTAMSGPAKQNGAEASKPEQQQTLQAPPSKMPPSRGASGKSTLETVQENSADTTQEPSPAAVQAAADLKPLTKVAEDGKSTPKRSTFEDLEKHTKGSESESGGNKSDGKRSRRTSVSQTGNNTQQPAQQQRPKNPPPSKSSFPALASSKSRQPESSTRNMTVETETVQSIPQSAISAGDRSGGPRGENSGTLRLKPSSETIRPKKERKKPSAKARSINQGTGMLRSPLLLQRGSVDDLHGSTCVSSTASLSEESGPGSPQPQTRTYSQQFRNVFSSFGRRNNSNSRAASNRNLRKASSRADIFEARVANAVDEANSSDSEETFVYESNPPEQQRRPRHHSRTPSVTSSHSTADQRSGIRNFNDIMDERRVAGKRSMKFSNNPFNELDSPGDRQDGTVRSHQPRHYGRWGRNGNHASMFDQDSPFTQASKLRNSATNLRHSRPNSPRSPQSLQHNRVATPTLFGGRKNDSSFDFDGEGADDERTPLVGTVRTPRGSRHGHARIHSSSHNSIDEYYGVRWRSRCGRLGSCLFGFAVFVAVVLAAVAFLIMSNRPMYEVQISKIQNVLASEQEIMLDLRVGAINPNALGITVTDMDVNVFAKSKHVGSTGDWRAREKKGLVTSLSEPVARRRRRRDSGLEEEPADNKKPWLDLSDHWRTPSPDPGHDHGTDPDPSNPSDSDAQTMLLGRIFHFDQSLAFEGSPIKHHLHYSVGELRLAHPGNKTEAGGSQRWEEVLKHPFELIIRGVLKYQLPINSKETTAAVGASVLVHPEDGVDQSGGMRLEKIRHEEHWQWVDWEEVLKDEGRRRVEEVD